MSASFFGIITHGREIALVISNLYNTFKVIIIKLVIFLCKKIIRNICVKTLFKTDNHYSHWR